MAESAAERLTVAVDNVIARGTLGDTTARRMRRAASELSGSVGRTAVAEEMLRVHEAHEAGRLDLDVYNETLTILAEGAGRPAGERAAVRQRAGLQRSSRGRSLVHVPDGTRLVYDGVWGTVRGGRLTVEGGVGTFDTPTPAAKAVTGEESVNGWKKWRLVDGRTLADGYDSGRWT